MTLELDDMTVVGEPPAKLLKALAVIATRLHQSYDERPRYKPDASRKGCILSSLTVRDYLFRIGFTDAEVVPVLFAVHAERNGEYLHSLGVGDMDHRAAAERPKDGWPGHLVVMLPKTGWLIDTTLFNVRRPQWPNFPHMLAVALTDDTPTRPLYGLKPIAGITTVDEGNDVDALWLHQPKNKFWRNVPDAGRRRRDPVIEHLVATFGEWEDD